MLYAWSKRSKLFHYIFCDWVGRISEDKLVTGTKPPDGKTCTGFVAKTRECAIAGPSDEIAASDGQPKQLFDKLQLREWVTYFPPPVRAVPIPKKSGGERILGVPTVIS